MNMRQITAFINDTMPETPFGWEAFGFDCSPDAVPPGFIKVTGGVPIIVSRGKRKGAKSWAAKIGRRTLFVDEVKAQAWIDAREIETGVCQNCEGKGEVCIKWSSLDGRSMKPCGRCNGTGRYTGANQ